MDCGSTIASVSRVANANGILLDALEFVLRSIASLDEDLSTLARVRREALATEGGNTPPSLKRGPWNESQIRNLNRNRSPNHIPHTSPRLKLNFSEKQDLRKRD
jgi:hypothetical protein